MTHSLSEIPTADYGSAEALERYDKPQGSASGSVSEQKLRIIKPCRVVSSASKPSSEGMVAPEAYE